MFDHKAYHKKWRKANKDKMKSNAVKHRYGVSLEEYEEKIKPCKNCGICGREFQNDKDKHFDHNHISKKFRGVLCTNCNLGLGHFKDNKEILSSAINYLIENDYRELTL